MLDTVSRLEHLDHISVVAWYVTQDLFTTVISQKDSAINRSDHLAPHPAT